MPTMFDKVSTEDLFIKSNFNIIYFYKEDHSCRVLRTVRNPSPASVQTDKLACHRFKDADRGHEALGPDEGCFVTHSGPQTSGAAPGMGRALSPRCPGSAPSQEGGFGCPGMSPQKRASWRWGPHGRSATEQRPPPFPGELC